MTKASNFKPEFLIGDKMVGGSNPCLIIAEAGVAHFGDFEIAKELVDLAATAKADVFKTQIFDVDTLFSEEATAWKDRLRPRNLSLSEVGKLKEYAESKGLIFLATAHDASRISWLKELNVAAVKIGSGERNNPAFVEELAKLGKPIILSTGMYSFVDIREAQNACIEAGCDELALLHCVTSYPTPDEFINLASVDRMIDEFSCPIGYSDHSVDALSVLGAVAKGAKIIERHITTLKNVPNAQDWKVSSSWEDFPELITQIRRIELMNGNVNREIQPIEKSGMEWALKSLFYKTDLAANHTLTESDFEAKRPGDGLRPTELPRLVGHQLKAKVKQGTRVSFEHVR